MTTTPISASNPEQTTPTAGHRQDMTARSHDARDSSGRARVTRMMADGTVKNVWGEEPSAEVDLDLTGENAWAEMNGRPVPDTATLAEALGGNMVAQIPAPDDATYDCLFLTAVEDPINDTDEPLVFAAAGVNVDFESEAAKRLDVSGQEAAQWLDEHRDDIADYFYKEHHGATVLDDVSWSENRVDFYSRMPQGAYAEMTVRELHGYVAQTPGLNDFGHATIEGQCLDGLFQRLDSHAA